MSSPFQKARMPSSTAGKDGDGVTPSESEFSGYRTGGSWRSVELDHEDGACAPRYHLACHGPAQRLLVTTLRRGGVGPEPAWFY